MTSLPMALVWTRTRPAHMFREVGNYALHPVEPHDGDRETWLTETGATLLTIAARRSFVKLAALRERLTGSRSE